MNSKARIAAALSAARTRDGRVAFIGYAELYCESSDCAARTIEVHFKEFNGPLPPRLTCPACRRQLKLHAVQTLDEYERAFERDARCSVNAQIWKREHPDDITMPLGTALGDRLP